MNDLMSGKSPIIKTSGVSGASVIIMGIQADMILQDTANKAYSFYRSFANGIAMLKAKPLATEGIANLLVSITPQLR